MNTKKSLAELLVYYRSKADLTQEDLAQKSGVSKIQIARYETGKGSAPRLRTIMKLAEALGVSVSDLGYKTAPDSIKDTSYKLGSSIALFKLMPYFIPYEEKVALEKYKFYIPIKFRTENPDSKTIKLCVEVKTNDINKLITMVNNITAGTSIELKVDNLKNDTYFFEFSLLMPNQ